MAKVTGPLLSFGAKGKIGNAAVFANWKGIDYARQYVVPANPRTTAQQAIRTLFAFLREMWKVAPAEVVAPWNAFAEGRPLTGMNKFVGENVRVLKNDSTLADFIGSPGAKGGLPPVTFALTTGSGSGEVDWAMTMPNPPTGWTITSAVCAAVNDQDPTGIFDNSWQSEEDTTSTYGGTLSGFTASGNVVGCGWIVWEKPDGTAAYSVGLTDEATAGA